MKNNIRLAIAQINTTVGDLQGNSRKILEYMSKAADLGADIVSFPELTVTGYPPEDLLLKTRFIEDNMRALDKIVNNSSGLVAIVGFVDKTNDGIFNAAAIICDKRIIGIYHKVHLPNYSVFDEKRYFDAGNETRVFWVGGIIFGVNICEDIWQIESPAKEQASKGASLVIAINSSPYYLNRFKDREEIVKNQAQKNGILISYANSVGGQDELVFDGQSIIVDKFGRVIAKAKAFEEDLLVADVAIESEKAKSKETIIIAEHFQSVDKKPIAKNAIKQLGEIEEVFEALKLGLKDYVFKNGFKRVVIGLSGGIDSALVATIASDALGKNNTVGVFMPSRYSSTRSEEDARAIATNLGIEYIPIPIEPLFEAFLTVLGPVFKGLPADTAEENLQARIRGNILMALSNKFGWLVLTTGNKSEMSTGYATLYGDMAGGFALIKDVPKTLVYKLCKYINSIGGVIPDSIIARAPTAELRHNQLDQDTLPPYDVLDAILKAYVEENKGVGDILKMGNDDLTTSRVIEMVDKSEYKRRQSPPGIKITPRAFGRDRRMPITNRYKIGS